MTATSTRTLDMLPNTRNVAEAIAKDASENLAGVPRGIFSTAGDLKRRLPPRGRLNKARIRARIIASNARPPRPQ